MATDAAPNPRRKFFSDLAPEWDAMTGSADARARVREWLAQLALPRSGHVVDLGCGTGILTEALLEWLRPCATVSSVDFAPGMLLVGRQRITDPRVEWIEAEAESLPFNPSTIDTVLCFSTWPHFPRPEAVAAECLRVLASNGSLHIVHTKGREAINAIHRRASSPIAGDLLPPAGDLAALLVLVGFQDVLFAEDDHSYRVSGKRGPA